MTTKLRNIIVLSLFACIGASVQYYFDQGEILKAQTEREAYKSRAQSLETMFRQLLQYVRNNC